MRTMGKRIDEIYSELYDKMGGGKVTPPCFAPNANNRIDFKDHSPDFKVLERELLSVLNIFLTAMDDRGEAPVR